MEEMEGMEGMERNLPKICCIAPPLATPTLSEIN